MPLAPHTCSAPRCDAAVPAGAGPRCPAHDTRPPDRRPSAARRGYDRQWRRRRPARLAGRACIDCGAPAEVPDHWPLSRRELVALGVADPDDERWTVPRCVPCHNRRSARERR